ncbi:NAD(P)H-binding protein [Streptomyces sp. NPDC048594]|uniref:NAD(P)H-binding protein n=1 Tax=Streptomyces sp. NPDC048594 TaxID=3365575 RepID=UPI00371EDA72
MHLVIAGGHGKIARRLTRLLSARGDNVTGLIRNPDHADDGRADGAEPVVSCEASGVAHESESRSGCAVVPGEGAVSRAERLGEGHSVT